MGLDYCQAEFYLKNGARRCWNITPDNIPLLKQISETANNKIILSKFGIKKIVVYTLGSTRGIPFKRPMIKIG